MSEPATRLDTRFSAPGSAATPWQTTLQVLQAAQLSWISTVRRDGRPHVSPLVAVWHDGAIHFSMQTQGESIVLQMLRPLATGVKIYSVDSTIKFGAEITTR